MHRPRLNCLAILCCLLIRHAADEKSKEQEFIFDHYWSPYASSSLLLSGRAFLSEAEDLLIPKISTSFWGRYASSIGNNILNDVLMLINHEVNGHGFRQRSFGERVRGYGIFPLFYVLALLTPVNGLGAFTRCQDPLATIDEDLMVIIAGNEANSVLAKNIILKNFALKTLDYRLYNLFFKSFTNLLGYITTTNNNRSRDDIAAYLREINKKHGFEGIQLHTLRMGALSFFLNPIPYIAIWSFYAHLFQGKEKFTIPYLKLGGINYMPLIRMGLTPFGLMYYLENYIGYGDKTFLVSIDGGSSPFYASYYGGIQLQTDGLGTYKNYGLDVVGHLWYQPKLQLQANDQIEDQNYWGGILGVNNKLKLGKFITLCASILYKTPGFVEGIVANGGFIFRGGFALHH